MARPVSGTGHDHSARFGDEGDSEAMTGALPTPMGRDSIRHRCRRHCRRRNGVRREFTG
jgi:hypothetical protein